MRYWKTLLIALAIGFQPQAFSAGIPVQLYQNPNCGCCKVYADYLRGYGFEVQSINTTDLGSIKKKYAVPERLEGCHTAIISGYVFEGLIPADMIKRVLSEHRPITGISLPGMPEGAPGMTGNKTGPLHVYYIKTAPALQIFGSF